MRYMMLMIPKEYGNLEDGSMFPVEEFKKMGKYNDELTKAGILLSLDGLHPSSSGTRVHYNNGEATVVDGPFAEAKEVLGGYWIIQVKSKEEAVEWAKRIPAMDGDIVEVRQVQEMADFPPEIRDLIGQ